MRSIKMSKSCLHDYLMETLAAQTGVSFTVVSIRDQMVKGDISIEMDHAALRRWINGKFKTFVKKGLLISETLPDRKRHSYILSPDFPLGNDKTESKGLNIDDEKTEISNSINRQLQEYRMQLNIQLGEASEYQRLCSEYPALKKKLVKKTELLIEDNHRLLGRLRALEETLKFQEVQ